MKEDSSLKEKLSLFIFERVGKKLKNMGKKRANDMLVGR